MLYNIDKCHHVHIGANTEASKYEMASVDNKITIKRVVSEKDLGVFNVDKLNFREHITKKINIANRSMWNIQKLYIHTLRIPWE